MKTKILTLALIAINSIALSQVGGVSINNTGANPDGSAMLDIESTDKGLLIPRLQLSDINDAVTVTTAANSLLVFNLAPSGVAPNNVVEGFYYWDASITQWVKLVSGAVVGTDDQQIDSLVLVGNTLTAYVEDGGSSSVDLSALSDADSDPTNEHNTGANLTGTDLNIIDGGGTQTVDLSALLDSSYAHDEWKDSDTLGGGFTTNFVYANQAKGFGNDVVVTDSGRVGIGTVTPQDKFEIYEGHGRISSSLGHTRLKLENTNLNGETWELISSSNGSFGLNNGSSWTITSTPTGNIGIGHHQNVNLGNTGALSVTGSVGIGTLTPQESLDINTGSLRMKNAGTVSYNLNVQNNVIGGINFAGPTFKAVGTNEPLLILASVGGTALSARLLIDNDHGINTSPMYGFKNDVNTGMSAGQGDVNFLKFITDGNEAVRIDPVGNVGIGTITPQFNLDVDSTINTGGHYNQFGQTVLTVRPNNALYASFNTAVGINALSSVIGSGTDGRLNVAVGWNALQDNIIGIHNTALGGNSLSSNVSGRGNVALGLNTLSSNTVGNWNIAIGEQVLTSNLGGVENIAIGIRSLLDNVSGDHNIAIGTDALKTATTSGNIAIGYRSGIISTGANNTFLGTILGDFTGNNNVVIGSKNYAVINPPNTSALASNNSIFINSNNGQERIRIDNNGNVGIGTSAPTQKFAVNNGTSIGTYTTTGWVHTSDARLKTNVASLTGSLDKVMQIQGVNFDWINAPEENRQIGFLAQDLEKILPEAVVVDSLGNYGVAYGNLTPLLVEAVKELKNENNELKQEIEGLKSNKTIKEEKLSNLEASVSSQLNTNKALQAQIDELKQMLLQTSKK